jgi:hypothetical protein
MVKKLSKICFDDPTSQIGVWIFVLAHEDALDLVLIKNLWQNIEKDVVSLRRNIVIVSKQFWVEMLAINNSYH